LFKKTKVVCTMGPSTDKPGVIESLLQAGMNVARFNFSHGTHPEQEKRINMVREASQKANKPVALLLDTKGPEMRLGLFQEGKAVLEAGQKFVLTVKDVTGTKEMASVNHKRLPREVKVGERILLNDGLISLLITAIEGEDIITTVQNTGQVSDRKRVAAPGASISLPPLSEQDIKDLEFGIKMDLDFIAASFIQRAADILAIRKVLEKTGAQLDIIAKIENAEGVKNIDEILKVADGIMVARGDLGVEIPTEEVPMVQKMIIKKCNRAGKPVITATQMLESMILNPRPTRAEASDIANAILDGSDAVMLSGETASGQYPLEAVKTMVSIALRTEESILYSDIVAANALAPQKSTTDAISHASVQVAHDLSAGAIMTSTFAGHTARMISKYRPQAAIVATTPSEKALRSMLLLWGVFPILASSSTNTDELVQSAIAASLDSGIIKNGDLIVFTAGVPLGMSGTTNMIRVYVVGNALLKGSGVGNKSVTGTICVIKSAREIETKFKTGDILVITGIDEETAVYAANASAIIAEEGGFTSHAAVVGISYGIPVLIGVDGATERLSDGMVVTVDPSRGTVYQGEINAR
jgi:pyruvate kinase